MQLTELRFIKRKFNQKDCDGMEMVIAATDDNALNHEIAEYCKANGHHGKCGRSEG